MSQSAAYDRLTDRFRRIATIGECSSMLGWDAAAVMPPGGGSARGDQLALLAGLAHQALTAPEVEADLEAATADGDWDSANLHLMRHAYVRAKAVPEALVVAQTKANSTCEKIWRKARQNSDDSRNRERTGAGAGTDPLRRTDGRVPKRYRRR
jgi:carboxypeptidase Taq